AALMTSDCTCDTKPMVGTRASTLSRFISAIVPSGSALRLFRSKITNAGALFRISPSAAAAARANTTAPPSWEAACLIFEVNIKSSRTARITATPMIIETQAVQPFLKNGFVVACDETREAVLIDPGDEVPGLLEFADRNRLAIRHILLTHAHVDHITGVAAAKRALDVPIHLHSDDLFLYDGAVQQQIMIGLPV